jgi:hypothetical protein
MGLITGKYLEDPHNPDLALWEAEDIPEVGDWPPGVPYTWTTEESELMLLALLRMLKHDGVPFAVPCVHVEGRYCPLTREAVSDLNKDAQDKVLYFPSQLIVMRLVKDEDEEVLPESLARKLLTFAGIARPEDPFTISFSSAAAILMEFLPGNKS